MHNLTDKLWKKGISSHMALELDTLITDFMKQHDEELKKSLWKTFCEFKLPKHWGIEKRREQAEWLKKEMLKVTGREWAYRADIDTAFGLEEKKEKTVCPTCGEFSDQCDPETKSQEYMKKCVELTERE